MLILHAATPDDYASAVAAHPRLLVDFYKDDCPGCTMLDMSLKVLASAPEAAGVVLLKVKLEQVGEAFFRDLGLRQTPTLVLFRDGAEVARLPGFQSPAQLAQAVGAHLAMATPPAPATHLPVATHPVSATRMPAATHPVSATHLPGTTHV